MSGEAGLRPPAVFTIDAGLPFSDALANGLIARVGTGPDLARVTLLVPTRRAVRALRDAFLRETDGVPLLLPVIRPIGDVDEDDLAATEAVTLSAGDSNAALTDLPPAVPGLGASAGFSRSSGVSDSRATRTCCAPVTCSSCATSSTTPRRVTTTDSLRSTC